jgi:hypothetical protein
MQDELYIPPEYWLKREISKVKDPQRRAALYRMFAGQAGYEKFLEVMKVRHGLPEFETGEWARSVPRLSESGLKAKHRPCKAGCGRFIAPLFSPWGELVEDFDSICPKCKRDIDGYSGRV